jgi:hypothetical protein
MHFPKIKHLLNQKFKTHFSLIAKKLSD